MITTDRVKKITGLAFPICIALSATSLMGIIDLIMVGRLGNYAIAAVGLSVFCNMLLLAFVKGIAPAVQGIVARRIGEGSTDAKCLPLNAGLLLAIVVGAPLTILAYWLSPALFAVFSHDPEVTKIGVPFLRILYLAIIVEGMLNAFKGTWSGVEKPKVYMSIVICMNCLNVVINYILIFGHFGIQAMGARGAAIGTVTSLCFGLLLNFLMVHFRFKNNGFLSAKPKWELLARIMKMGLPSTMQEFFFSLGSVVLLGMIGKVGTSELAAATPLIRIMTVLTLLSISLGMASATLVSKTIGEGDLDGAAEWGWDTGKLGVIGITLLGLPVLLFPRVFLAMFLTEAHTISIAVLPLQLIAATTGLWSLIYIFAYTLYSVGDGKRVMIVSFSTQWLFFLPVVWLVGPYLRYGLPQIWMVATAHGAISTAWITALWGDGKWKKIRI